MDGQTGLWRDGQIDEQLDRLICIYKHSTNIDTLIGKQMERQVYREEDGWMDRLIDILMVMDSYIDLYVYINSEKIQTKKLIDRQTG